MRATPTPRVAHAAVNELNANAEVKNGSTVTVDEGFYSSAAGIRSSN